MGMVFGVILLAIIGAVGYFGYQYVAAEKTMVNSQSYKTESVTKVGILQAAKGDDYSYVVLTEGKSIGVATQQVDLSPFVGRKVTITGQFSGTTLYADTITTLP